MQICSTSPCDVMLQLFCLRFPFQAFSTSAAGGPGPLIQFTYSGLIKSLRKTAISNLFRFSCQLSQSASPPTAVVSEKCICNCELPGCKPSITWFCGHQLALIFLPMPSACLCFFCFFLLFSVCPGWYLPSLCNR